MKMLKDFGCLTILYITSTFHITLLMLALDFTQGQRYVISACLAVLVDFLYELDNWKSLRD